MADEPKIKLPIAFTTYEYSKKEGKRVPIGVVVVTKAGIRGIGLRSYFATRHMNRYDSALPDGTAQDFQNFAVKYYDNASNGSRIGISIDATPYTGDDKKTVDNIVAGIMSKNADAVLAANKKSKETD